MRYGRTSFWSPIGSAQDHRTKSHRQIELSFVSNCLVVSKTHTQTAHMCKQSTYTDVYIYIYIHICYPCLIYTHINGWISNTLYPIWKHTHEGFTTTPHHTMPGPPQTRPGRGGGRVHGVGWAQGYSLRVYFHIGFPNMILHICIYIYGL